jgi:hypothetical protein
MVTPDRYELWGLSEDRQATVPVMVLQSARIYLTPTVVVCPLRPYGPAAIVDGLTPVIELDGARQLVLTYLMTAIDRRHLRERLAPTGSWDWDVSRAMDRLLQGI